MKTVLTNYTFDKTTRTVTLPDFNSDFPFNPSGLMLITNVTTNTIIYNFADAVLGYSGYTVNSVTLDYNTTAMSNLDKLQIIYDASTTSRVRPPTENDWSINVNAVPQRVDRISFARAIAGNVDTDWGAIIGPIGTGQTVNQTAGNLLLTTGTTVNQETVIRSNASFRGGIRLRVRSTLSQRIANQSFYAELVDVIGDNLTTVINSATSITVTYATNPFTAANVGQSMFVGNYVGTGTFLSGRYPIASVSGNTVTYTVAGFAVGTGTSSVFGWNYYHLLYDGTTATQYKYDTQRKGYATGDTLITGNTTAAPGHMAVITGNDMSSVVTDSLVTSTASQTRLGAAPRASRDENVPDDIDLRVQLRILNGSVAPASTTTWTIGFVSTSNFASQDVVIQDTRMPTYNSPLPIAGAISGSVTSTPTTAGAAYNLVTTASTNAAFIKNAAGSLFELTLSNPTATPAYVKLYNKASAPTVGTDIPILTLPLLATSASTFEFGTLGKRFTTGIAIAVTAAITDADTAVAVAGAKVHATYI